MNSASTNANVPSADPRAGQRRLASNVVLLTVTAVLVNVSLFAANWLMIRQFGQATHGSILWVVAVASIAGLVADLGIGSKAGVRTIASLRSAGAPGLGDTVSGMVTAQVVVSFLIGAVLFASAHRVASWHEGVEPLYLRMAGVWVALDVAVRCTLMLAYGYEMMRIVLALQPLVRVCRLAWVIVVAAVGLDVPWLFVGWTGAHLLAAGVGIIVMRRMTRQVGLSVQLGLCSISEMTRVIAAALPYYVAYVGEICLPFVVQLIVGHWQSGDQISDFQVCFTLAVVSRLLSMPMAMALFPRMAHSHAMSHGERDTSTSVLPFVARTLGVLGTGLFALYWASGGQLLEFVYGAGYRQAAPTLLLLAAAIAVENYSVQLDQVLMARKRAPWVAGAEVFKYLLLGIASAVLVPTHGAFGAAIAFAVMVAGNAVVKMLMVRTQELNAGITAFGTSVLVLIAVAATGYFSDGWWALLVWVVAAFGLRLLRPRELWEAFGRRRPAVPNG